MISRGGNYSFAEMPEGDRGWVLCPEFAGTHPLEDFACGMEYADIPVRSRTFCPTRILTRESIAPTS